MVGSWSNLSISNLIDGRCFRFPLAGIVGIVIITACRGDETPEAECNASSVPTRCSSSFWSNVNESFAFKLKGGDMRDSPVSVQEHRDNVVKLMRSAPTSASRSTASRSRAS